ncbi:PilT/PilU family type 4a pilus ATPase [Colidextribacter sp. OB.20]|uniref:type IV pilus twitching motility protein PilT n=1 Tax=Colidextribacter sp. OB.20 TaxID=2304568 RepID=UPI00136C9945|nr:PilT/PilU family type 4a pilus ATPase [Colidextribacter sp. OB.20]NBI09553.1 PilT/PilU family type 4a pilus ATPase [Colidextribacter sp. OB.20]
MGLNDYLKRAVEDRASDLFIVAGAAVSAKRENRLIPITSERVMPREAETLVHEAYDIANRPPDRFFEEGDDDFSFSVAGLARFRVNVYRQRGSMAMVIRVVAFDIPHWRDLSIPDQIMSLADVFHGMILVTGTAGSGKSTTQACIIDQINRTKECHIITLEDPIEYLHRNRRSIVSQREIAIDTIDYPSALRACLRQAPDVILLGEMRDQETIHTAMTAAETGHLLIATLHTNGAVNTIDRIVDTFPSGQQEQVRAQLSMVLHTVVSQQLVPGVRGKLVPAFEIMRANNAIRSLIRDNKTYQIDNAIAAGSGEGMMTMDQSLLALYRAREITADSAISFADNPEQMRRRIG